MGRSHNGIALSHQSPLTRTRLIAGIVMFGVACALILLTPYRLRAEEASNPASAPTAQASAESNNGESAKATWAKSLSSSVAPTDLSSTSSRATKGFIYVLGILLLAVASYRKFAGKRAAQSTVEIEVIARKAVSPKHALLIVNVEGERLLLAQGTESLTFVTKLSSSYFSSELAQFMEGETEQSLEELASRERIISGTESLKRAGNR